MMMIFLSYNLSIFNLFNLIIIIKTEEMRIEMRFIDLTIYKIYHHLPSPSHLQSHNLSSHLISSSKNTQIVIFVSPLEDNLLFLFFVVDESINKISSSKYPLYKMRRDMIIYFFLQIKPYHIIISQSSIISLTKSIISYLT